MIVGALDVAPTGQYHDGTCYRIHGDMGAHQAVVFVHGVGLNQSMWSPWCDALSNRYCLVTYDLLGHGSSHNPAGARTLADFSEQLMTLVRHLGLRRWHLVGFSLGALVALHYAAGNTKREFGQPESLVLLHSVFERSTAEIEAIEKRYLMTREAGPMSTIEVAIERWFSEDWIKNSPQYIDALRNVFRLHVGDDGYLKAYRVFCDADVEIADLDLPCVAYRTMVVTGSLDTGSTPAMARMLARRLDGRLVVNEGHRHMAPVEYVETLSAQVDHFISEA